jgi:hypothetical protein
VTGALVAALHEVWSTVRARHPEVPDVVLVVGAGSIGAPRGTLRLGHFAANRWHHTPHPDPSDEATTEATTESTPEATSEARSEARSQAPAQAPSEAPSAPSAAAAGVPEVFVGGEGLRRGPLDVLGTVLHEAAHALAHARGVRDTSRQGRYHNARYAEIARELGLTVDRDPRIGWSLTTMPPATVEAYADVLPGLARALTHWRTSEPTGPDTGRASSNNPIPCECACDRRIRVALSTLLAGPIVCGLCDQPFTPTT